MGSLSRAILIFFSVVSLSCYADIEYIPSESNLKNREWFKDAKYGMFIHWGIYSQLAGGGDVKSAEWIMENQKIPVKQYEKLAQFFNPIEFDPAEWVKLVKKAGMKYITITTRHHDGFSMFDSNVCDFNIVKKTPFSKDILKMLKEECDKQGVKLFFYYSQLDWRHPDYYLRGETGIGYTGRPEGGDWSKYIDYMNSQLTELLKNYGEVAGIWFDGMWDKPNADWRLSETYELIHNLQPGALIGSNHHVQPFQGEDFQMFERDLPGENTMGFNKDAPISALPLEMCETMNGSWGYNLVDTKYKTSKELVHKLIRAAGYGSNLLLNTGPMSNGKIQPENVDTLLKIGKWLEQYGETIYGTRQGPFPPAEWGVSVVKDESVLIHVLDAKTESIIIDKLSGRIKSVVYWEDGSKVKYEETDLGIIIHIPHKERNLISTVIKIEFKK